MLVAGVVRAIYPVADRMAEAHQMICLVEQGWATQHQVANALGCFPFGNQGDKIQPGGICTTAWEFPCCCMPPCRQKCSGRLPHCVFGRSMRQASPLKLGRRPHHVVSESKHTSVLGFLAERLACFTEYQWESVARKAASADSCRRKRKCCRQGDPALRLWCMWLGLK